MEPGLEQTETLYSLTYVVLFVSHAIAAVATGLLFNHIPTWYLLLVSTLCHILGYLLYALATSGWMMILARALAGLQTGSVDSLVFAYYSVSFEKYTENLKTLDRFEETTAKKVKGYLFSSACIAYAIGYGLGVGMIGVCSLGLENFISPLLQGSQQSWLSFQRLHSSERLAGSVWLLE